MGGGKTKAQTNQMISEQYGQEKSAYGRGTQRSEADLGRYQSRNEDLYDILKNQYSSLAGTGGGGGGNQIQAGPGAKFGEYGPGSPGSSGSSGVGGGGGPQADTRLADVEAFYRKQTGPQGGWDPDRLRSVQGDISGVRGMANDPEIARRMRGAGVFDEFAQTGGYSEADKANIRARGTSGVPAMFGRMRDEANRIGAIQGGYGPGRAALTSRMGRDQAGAAANAALNAELGISEGVRQGRMGAASALSGAEGNLQSLRGEALRGAYGMESGLEGDIYGRQRAGFAGLEGRAESDRAAAANAAAAAASGDRWNQQFQFQKQQAGLEGLSSLYGSSEGGYGRGLDYDLRNRGTSANIQQGNIEQRMQNNPKTDWTKLLGAGAGTVGAFF